MELVMDRDDQEKSETNTMVEPTGGARVELWLQGWAAEQRG